MTLDGATEPYTVRLRVLGSTFVVSCVSARDADIVREHWSRLLSETATAADVPLDLRSMPVELQGRALLSQLTIRAIEAAAGTRLMLHAGGIADNVGRVVAMVGPSGMGKTTASAYLSRHGFGYVTDETVSIGADGSVLPFDRPLWLRGPHGEMQRSPDGLGLGVPPESLTIARVVLLDRVRKHSGPPALTSVPLVDALLDLVPHASALARLPDPLQFMSRIVDRCGGVLRLTYREMDQRVMTVISELLERKSTEAEPWRPLDRHRSHPDDPNSGRSTDGGDEVLFQAPIADGIATDTEALVLVDDIPVRLGEIGFAIWEAAHDGVAETEVVSVVERGHGTHPQASRIVREAVGQMLRVGLLVYGAAEPPVASAASR